MQESYIKAIDFIQKKILDPVSIAFGAKKSQQSEQTQAKRVHVRLVDQLTRMTRLVDKNPGIMQTVEKARFIVQNAPLGTRPAGKALLLKSVVALESVADKEPQLRLPLKRLKPLVQEYLGLDTIDLSSAQP